MPSCSIISPAYPCTKEQSKEIENNIKKIGFEKVKFFTSNKKLFNKWAGEPYERLELFYNAWNSSDDCIICSKGGSGVSHILPKINVNKLKKKKLIVGYSDITLLLNFIHQKLNLITLHGPMGLKKLDKKSISALKDALSMKDYGINFSKKNILNNSNERIVSAEIIGGNLTRFVEFLMHHKINFINKIIFFEETNFTEYKMFNLLMSLKSYKYFKPKAILFGGLGIKNKKLMIKMIKYLFPNIPIIINLPFGHTLPNITIPIGAKCEINFKENKIKFIFPKKAKKYSINLKP